jgi:hypothetical protein
MKHRPDIFGLVLIFGLGAVLLLSVGAVVFSGLMTLGELLGVAAVGGVLLTAYRPQPPSRRIRNNQTHGGARPAAESEAVRAARGNPDASKLDHHDFNE